MEEGLLLPALAARTPCPVKQQWERQLGVPLAAAAGAVPHLSSVLSALCPSAGSPESLSRILEKFSVLVVWEPVLIPDAI